MDMRKDTSFYHVKIKSSVNFQCVLFHSLNLDVS